MPLLNYTSNVDADKTAAEISKCLSSHGAQSVMTEYDPEDQTIKSIAFVLSVSGKSLRFRLPCDWKPVFEILLEQIPVREAATTGLESDIKKSEAIREKRLSERRLQAVRTAWRIVKDWVEAQLALVETHMVKTEQVFLPYAVMKNGKTLSEQVLSGEFLLGDGK